MKHSLYTIAIVAIGLFVAGCYPSESELTIKTSDFNKAMRGEVAEIMVKVESLFEREKESRCIKNIDDKVSVGISGVETGRDFANFLARVCSNAFMYSESMTYKPLRRTMVIKVQDMDPDVKFKEFIEDKRDELQSVAMKMVASYPASLTRSGVLVRDKIDKEDPMPILCLDVNPTNGTLHISESNMASNKTFFYYEGRINGIFVMLDKMLDKLKITDMDHGDKEDIRNFKLIASQVYCLASLVHIALEVDYIVFVIEGDDDKPIFVVGKDVKVDDKLVADYRAWIRKGDKVRIEANRGMTGNGVRFFETEAQANAAEPIEKKFK